MTSTADPAAAAVVNQRGIVLAQQGQLDEALACFRQALQLWPDHVKAHNNLAAVLSQQGKLAEAVACYQEVVRLQPDAAAHANLGLLLSNLNQLPEATAELRQSLRLQPSSSRTHNQLGMVLHRQGQLDEAIACYRQALRLEPSFAQAYSNLGIPLKAQGHLDEAIHCHQQAVRLQPDFANGHCNLGAALQAQGKWAEALACYNQAVHLQPDHAQAHYNQGEVHWEQGQLDEAAACYRQALRFHPNLAEAHNSLGTVSQVRGQLAEAAACFDQALRLQPDLAQAHFNRSMLRLLQGSFGPGWSEYEWRWQCQDFPKCTFHQPRWDGSPLLGRTILLYAEQGLGDSIQFIRYAVLVKQRGGRVVLECSPLLLPLLARCPGVDQAVASGAARPGFAVQAPLLSLPGIFGTNLATIPAEIPYLIADPVRVDRWRGQLAGVPGCKVGIVWQGRPSHKWDRWRSILLAQFAGLAQVPGITLISLQVGPGSEQRVTVPFTVTDLGGQLDPASLEDLAAVLVNLDLVVTIDTAAAHLAGALGVPVWVLLHAVPDWRWLLEGEGSPWYPGMRLFRQTRQGEWTDVFERLAAEVRGVAAQSLGR